MDTSLFVGKSEAVDLIGGDLQLEDTTGCSAASDQLFPMTSVETMPTDNVRTPNEGMTASGIDQNAVVGNVHDLGTNFTMTPFPFVQPGPPGFYHVHQMPQLSTQYFYPPPPFALTAASAVVKPLEAPAAQMRHPFDTAAAIVDDNGSAVSGAEDTAAAVTALVVARLELEVAALQNARREDARAIAMRDDEISQLRAEVQRLASGGGVGSGDEDAVHSPFADGWGWYPQQRHQRQIMSRGTTVPGERFGNGCSGVCAVAVAAEETTSASVDGGALPDRRRRVEQRQGSGGSEPIASNCDQVFALQILDECLGKSPYSLGGLNGVSWDHGNSGRVGAKSIWSPLHERLESNTESGITSKDFINFGPVDFNIEESTSNASMSHLKSIWEVDDPIEAQRNCFEDEIAVKCGTFRHRGYKMPFAQAAQGSQQSTFHVANYLVDKIVRTQDQPASLLLQQKLKTTNVEARAQIIDAILHQAIDLIKNRFGNFLVQRCFEVGDAEQINLLTSSMLGSIALDVCSDSLKVSVINELITAIPETVTHRFACHVWQRIFETKWHFYPLPPMATSYPPQLANSSAIINEYERLDEEDLTVNKALAVTLSPQTLQKSTLGDTETAELALTPNLHPVIFIVRRMDLFLKGQWHSIANDESGSLVVQCIFENCPEVEKRGIVQEVLAHAGEIAKGQWGNWVIQHLLDRGYASDKAHIVQVVSHHIYDLSMDQFASKVVEKALKTCPKRELHTVVDRVIQGSLGNNGHPAIIDMMNNQYANYVVQHILTLTEPQQRDICVRLIAPHQSLLRASKYGQRVAAIVEKHLRLGNGTIMRDKFSVVGMNTTAKSMNLYSFSLRKA
ncbi:hypothetical protein HDU83_009339 [Entophlyctis luteolus]|nr:hypothetical protein HDU83_009339 [Entophlyctis luteolus]